MKKSASKCLLKYLTAQEAETPEAKVFLDALLAPKGHEAMCLVRQTGRMNGL
ncbi:hypothetical protein EHLJMEHL_02231 [Vreelandella titanicae]|tara:strand:- start:687 stop:842 length:156 start_codon:yes stop_codon:yes gene_type:complete